MDFGLCYRSHRVFKLLEVLLNQLVNLRVRFDFAVNLEVLILKEEAISAESLEGNQRVLLLVLAYFFDDLWWEE